MTNRTWLDVVKNVEKDFNAIANTHKAVKWREECEFALQAISNNPKLAACTEYTVQSAIKNVASVGLSLNPAYGYAYLTPEAKKTKGPNGSDLWVNEAQLRISFKGMVKLATDSGSIKVVKSEIVKENDDFTYNGPMAMPVHKITTPFDDDARGKPVGVYCIAITHEERALVDLMSWQEVEKIKSKAKTKNVWNEWPEEMAKKSMIKRASKQWPKTDQFERLQTAVSISNENEGSIDKPYLDEQYDKFHQYLNSGSSIEFAGYTRTLDEDTYGELLNSFEKGEKTKGRKMCMEKEKKGSLELMAIKSNYESDDEEIKESAFDDLNDLEKKIAISFIKNFDKLGLKNTAGDSEEIKGESQ